MRPTGPAPTMCTRSISQLLDMRGARPSARGRRSESERGLERGATHELGPRYRAVTASDAARRRRFLSFGLHSPAPAPPSTGGTHVPPFHVTNAPARPRPSHGARPRTGDGRGLLERAHLAGYSSHRAGGNSGACL